jgi:hypothetical protein
MREGCLSKAAFLFFCVNQRVCGIIPLASSPLAAALITDTMPLQA